MSTMKTVLLVYDKAIVSRHRVVNRRRSDPVIVTLPDPDMNPPRIGIPVAPASVLNIPIGYITRTPSTRKAVTSSNYRCRTCLEVY